VQNFESNLEQELQKLSKIITANQDYSDSRLSDLMTLYESQKDVCNQLATREMLTATEL
jgi:hypothetical protein